MRIAAIDIGTNSIHMVIARSTPAGFELADREREVVQIGRGSFEKGRLRADAIRRSAAALARFVDLARRQQVDRILCTATAAVREAKNGGSFIEAAREAAGITPRVIPPEEEGRLIYLGVKSALRLDERPAVIIDIGGGSTQLVVANRDQLIESRSAPLGALRLTERLLHSDPPSRRELLRLRRHVRRVAADPLRAIAALKPQSAYGSSGSIHALAQLAHHEDTGQALPQLNGHVLTRDSLERLIRRLQHLTLAAREKLPGIDPKRAEILIPGAIVLSHVLESLELDALTISDFGVREGLVMDYLASHTREVRTLGEIEDLRLRSVLQLLQKFQPEERHLRHARHVARLSLALFDGLRALHRMDNASREILHFAALLHDVGAVVGYDGHAEHSAYVIRNGSLRGLSAAEIEMISIVARYHGKGRPRKKDRAVRALDRAQRRKVRWLSAMLRVAEGLDRSHYQLVQEVRVLKKAKRISLRLTVRRGAGLEVWAARRRLAPLERLTGAVVTISARTVEPAGRARRPAPPSAGTRRRGRNGSTPESGLAPVVRSAGKTPRTQAAASARGRA